MVTLVTFRGFGGIVSLYIQRESSCLYNLCQLWDNPIAHRT